MSLGLVSRRWSEKMRWAQRARDGRGTTELARVQIWQTREQRRSRTIIDDVLDAHRDEDGFLYVT